MPGSGGGAAAAERTTKQGRDPTVDWRPPPDKPAAPYERAELLDVHGAVVGVGPPLLTGSSHSWIRVLIAVPPSATPTTGVRVDLVSPAARYTVWEGEERFDRDGTFTVHCPIGVTERALEFARGR